MVKSIHTLTIGDYSLFEQTGKVKYLCNGFTYKPNIEPLLAEIVKGLEPERDETEALQTEKHRIKSIYRIQYLTALYDATYNLLIHKCKIDEWKALIGKGKPSNYLNLIYYLAQIEAQTGIVIDPENWDDKMIELHKEVQLWTDKYNQAFMNRPTGEGVTFFQIVMGVFSALQFPLNEQISMSNFLEMKKQAEEISKRLKQQADAG